MKISVIPNGLEKYIAFILNKNLVFTDSMVLILMSTPAVLKNLTKKNCLLEQFSIALQEKEKIGNDSEISDGHVSVKDYLAFEKIWN